MLRPALLALLLLLAALPAAAAPPELPGELGVSEQELESLIKSGRLKNDDLIRAGDKVSWFTKLGFYIYAQELEPYFEGVEKAIRDLARTPAERPELIAARRDALALVLKRSHDMIMASDREDPATDWRRGLLGLIYLDQDWRGRVKDRRTGEITNPYDLVALIDCMDAGIRGLEEGDPADCPVLTRQEPASNPEETPNEPDAESGPAERDR